MLLATCYLDVHVIAASGTNARKLLLPVSFEIPFTSRHQLLLTPSSSPSTHFLSPAW
jgi:hypothetical protein